MTETTDRSPLPDSGPGAESSTPRKVGIIVLNWNNYTATRRCLESLGPLPAGRSPVYLVDNGSGDGSMDRLEREFADRHMTFVRNGVNLGFSAGSNRGIRRALEDGCTHILLLNNDCIVPDPTGIGRAMELADSDPRCGIVGGKVLMWPDTGRIWSVGGAVSSIRESFRGHGELDCGQYDRIAETGFVSGAFMLIKAQVIERLGPLPEEYFFGHEDREYCLRAQRAGFRLLYQPTAVVYHEAGLSHQAADPFYIYNDVLSKILLRRRTLPAPAFRLWLIVYTSYVHVALPALHRLWPKRYLLGARAGLLRSVTIMAIRDSVAIRRISLETLEKFRERLQTTSPGNLPLPSARDRREGSHR